MEQRHMYLWSSEKVELECDEVENVSGGQGLPGHEVFSKVMERIEELLARKWHDQVRLKVENKL